MNPGPLGKVKAGTIIKRVGLGSTLTKQLVPDLWTLKAASANFLSDLARSTAESKSKTATFTERPARECLPRAPMNQPRLSTKRRRSSTSIIHRSRSELRPSQTARFLGLNSRQYNRSTNGIGQSRYWLINGNPPIVRSSLLTSNSVTRSIRKKKREFRRWRWNWSKSAR